MEELVTKKFGAAKWKESLKNAGMPETRYFGVSDDVPDAEIVATAQSACCIFSLLQIPIDSCR